MKFIIELLVIATGNIRNAALESLFLSALPAIVAALSTHSYLELTGQALVVPGYIRLWEVE